MFAELESFTSLFTNKITDIKRLWYAKNIRIFWDQLSNTKGFTICKTTIIKQTTKRDYRFISFKNLYLFY